MPPVEGAVLVLSDCGVSIEGAAFDESGTDELPDRLEEFDLGAVKLSDCTEELGGGAVELLVCAEEFGGGTSELLVCAEEFDSGVSELLVCAEELDSGVSELLGCTEELDSGAAELLEEEFEELTVLLVRAADEEESALDVEEPFELLLALSEWLMFSAAPALSMSPVGPEQLQTKRQSRTEKINRIRLPTDGFFFISNTSHTADVKLY